MQNIAESHEQEREKFEQKLEKTKEAAAAKAAESQKKLAADMEHEAVERKSKRDGAKKEAMDELQKIESNLDKADQAAPVHAQQPVDDRASRVEAAIGSMKTRRMDLDHGKHAQTNAGTLPQGDGLHEMTASEEVNKILHNTVPDAGAGKLEAIKGMHEALTPTANEKAGLAELTKAADVADEGGSAAAFDDLKELNTFSAQEDQAIAGQLDGEAVVNEIGKSLGQSINPDVKNGNAHWAKK